LLLALNLCLQLALKLSLAGALLSLKAGDLTVDRAEQSLALPELLLHRSAFRGAFGDDLGLLGMRVLQPGAVFLDGAPELDDLGQHSRVLVGDAVGGVDAVDHVVEARRADDHVDRGTLVPGGVEGDEPGRERLLGPQEARLRDGELVRVVPQVALDLLQPDVREVVRLDRFLDARVELVVLTEHVLRLGLLRADRGVAKRRGCD